MLTSRERCSNLLASRSQQMYVPLAADDAAGCFHGNDDIKCSNQEPIKQDKEEEKKRVIINFVSVFLSHCTLKLGNGQNSHLDAHICIYRSFSKSYSTLLLFIYLFA